MSIVIAVPRESREDENRVGLVPSTVKKLDSEQVSFTIEADAGVGSNYTDSDYEAANIASGDAVFSGATIIVKVQPPTVEEVKHYPEGAVLISLLMASQNPELVNALQERKITSFALELLPRITRAQAMDVLSSQASAAGYKATLIAANLSQRFFPMLTTAAGTIRPQRVLVIGAGVAGLQAIATAKRLGAIVMAYDVRPEAKEQIESLGAKMVMIDIDARGEGGYARELTAEEKAQQQQALADEIAKAEIVITTAAIPGRPAPKIITKAMVENMQEGAVIVDMAAETGGNCELTEAGKTIKHNGVTLAGPLNIASLMARDASDMFSRNVANFLSLIVSEGEIKIDWEDEILTKSVVTHDGVNKLEERS